MRHEYAAAGSSSSQKRDNRHGSASWLRKSPVTTTGVDVARNRRSNSAGVRSEAAMRSTAGGASGVASNAVTCSTAGFGTGVESTSVLETTVFGLAAPRRRRTFIFGGGVDNAASVVSALTASAAADEPLTKVIV